MKVAFHGVRGSTPCHGSELARYGGNTSCVSVSVDGEDPLLFDMGTGLRYFGLTRPRGVPFRGSCLVSHLHWDHIQGLPFFTPMLCTGGEFTIYAPPQEGRTAADVLSTTICPPLFPITLDEFPGRIEVREAQPEFRIGSFEVMSRPIRHIGPTCGYRVTHGGVNVAYISDHQQPPNPMLVDEPARELCTGVDLLIHDAQYTPAEYARKSDWGHCTIEYAVWLAGEVGASRLALYHHDPMHDDDMLDRLEEVARSCGSSLGVEVFAAYEGLTVELDAR
jgi:phosphoribosyl 1,2-cyclic phosphodiesterase